MCTKQGTDGASAEATLRADVAIRRRLAQRQESPLVSVQCPIAAPPAGGAQGASSDFCESVLKQLRCKDYGEDNG
jgi:hypothetical protein